MSQSNILRVSNKSISLLLLAHYHFHHVYENDDFGSAVILHEHVIDLHVLTEKSGQYHHNDEAASIAASPEGVVKKSEPDYFPFILLAMSLLLLSFINRKLVLPFHFGIVNFKKRFLHFTPLLRAPSLL